MMPSELDTSNDVLIIRYGELSLKTLYVRRRFESILVNNIKSILDANNIKNKIVREWGRIYVYTTDNSKAIRILRRLFGVTSVSHAVKTDSNLDSISLGAVDMMSKNLKKNQSFALRVTRVGEHSYTSQEASRIIGDRIRKALSASVNLSRPDVELFIEIRDKHAYLFFDKIRGPGGYPLGSQGCTVALIDTARDLLAAWYMMRRGCSVVFVLINKELEDILSSFVDTWCSYRRSRVYNIYNESDTLKIVKDIINKNKCLGVVTGHSLYYDSDISFLKRMKDVVECPILSPLIVFDKEDIKKGLSNIGVSI
ncbi:MAG: THUMP domain-containing protein [Candidatus Thermoplasmatota archaeon]